MIPNPTLHSVARLINMRRHSPTLRQSKLLWLQVHRAVGHDGKELAVKVMQCSRPFLLLCEPITICQYRNVAL